MVGACACGIAAGAAVHAVLGQRVGTFIVNCERPADIQARFARHVQFVLVFVRVSCKNRVLAVERQRCAVARQIALHGERRAQNDALAGLWIALILPDIVCVNRGYIELRQVGGRIDGNAIQHLMVEPPLLHQITTFVG